MSAKSSSSSSSSSWRKLITKEDPFHIHKTLGILCLLSYAWRMPLAGQHDMGFVKYPQFTVPTLVLHFLLNATSFVFHIPVQRIKSGGYRIWPEYRWHSFIFLCRSLASMTLTWYEQQQQSEHHPQQHSYWINFAIVLTSIAAADVASQAQGVHRSPTIRGLDIPRGVQYFFSVAQVLATTGVLWGMRRYSTQFVFCWIIQGVSSNDRHGRTPPTRKVANAFFMFLTKFTTTMIFASSERLSHDTSEKECGLTWLSHFHLRSTNYHWYWTVQFGFQLRRKWSLYIARNVGCGPYGRLVAVGTS